jgi:hypothetical protein
MNDVYCENFKSCSSRYVTDIGQTAVGMLQTLDRQERCEILVVKLTEECDWAVLGGDGGGILKLNRREITCEAVD